MKKSWVKLPNFFCYYSLLIWEDFTIFRDNINYKLSFARGII